MLYQHNDQTVRELVEAYHINLEDGICTSKTSVPLHDKEHAVIGLCNLCFVALVQISYVSINQAVESQRLYRVLCSHPVLLCPFLFPDVYKLGEPLVLPPSVAQNLDGGVCARQPWLYN